MMRALGLLLVLAAPAVAAVPTDITGTWALGGEVSGVEVVETCMLKQAADGGLSGTCDTSTGKYEVKGKYDGKTVTFVHGGKYDGSDLVITYTGKVGEDGAIAGTMDVDPFSVSGSFTAKKDAAAK